MSTQSLPSSSANMGNILSKFLLAKDKANSGNDDSGPLAEAHKEANFGLTGKSKGKGKVC